MQTTHPKASLMGHFESLSHPRVQRTKDHELIDILVIGNCSLLCGGEGFNDMQDLGKAKPEWFKSFLRLPHGIASHDPFNRVFAALDPESEAGG